ncbi:hypothetical protein BDZ89DRAFT_633897 [Hymenopellis radicata]|nr:hypothetical protein BDZ89DRAFT_633897 [Hymenopellis radicata]
MNRNYGYKWKAEKKTGTSKPRPGCDHWYPGSRPFEVPEANSIANYVSTLNEPRAFLDVRSYGQMSERASPVPSSCSRRSRSLVKTAYTAPPPPNLYSSTVTLGKVSHGAIYPHFHWLPRFAFSH